MVIPADLSQPLRLERIVSADLATYEDLVSARFEAIDLHGPEATMYARVDGLLPGVFPPNDRATALAAVHSRSLRDGSAIVGDTMVTGPADTEGRDLSVPPEYIRLWLVARSFKVRKRLDGSDVWVDEGAGYDDVHAAYGAAVRLVRQASTVREILITKVP